MVDEPSLQPAGCDPGGAAAGVAVADDDPIWDMPDPECGRPVEFAGLTDEELEALSVPAAVPLWPVDEPAAGFAQDEPLDVAVPGVTLGMFADKAHARLGGLSDDELVGVLRAWRRQTSWAVHGHSG